MPRSTNTNACVLSTWNFRRVTKQLTTKLAKQTTPATFVTESTEANGAEGGLQRDRGDEHQERDVDPKDAESECGDTDDDPEREQGSSGSDP